MSRWCQLMLCEWLVLPTKNSTQRKVQTYAIASRKNVRIPEIWCLQKVPSLHRWLAEDHQNIGQNSDVPEMWHAITKSDPPYHDKQQVFMICARQACCNLINMSEWKIATKKTRQLDEQRMIRYSSRFLTTVNYLCVTIKHVKNELHCRS